MSWFWLTIISVGALAVYYFSTKGILNHEKTDPRIFGGLSQLGVGLVALPLAIKTGFHFEVSWTSVVLLGCAGGVFAIASSLYYSGLKRVDLSEATILEASGIFWSLLFGFFILREGLSVEKLLATLLIFISIYLVSDVNARMRLNRSEVFVIVASGFYALGSVLDKSLVGYSNPITYLSLGFLVAGFSTLLSNVGRFTKYGLPMFRRVRLWQYLVVNWLCVAVAYWALFRAYELGGEVSVMYPITHSQSILVTVLGIVFLNERKKLRSKLVALVILIGALYLLRPT